VLHAREQIGGQGRTDEQQMDGFREAVAFCGLSDLGYIGLPNIWDNREQDGNNTKVRLDRGLVSAEFLNLFSTVKVWHVQTTESDHCSLVLECSQTEGRRNKKKRTIRYENMSKISELLSREETMERQRLVLNGLRTVIEALLSSKPRRKRGRKLIELMP
jgi:hypothetical protein